jgi:hypothetical protein
MKLTKSLSLLVTVFVLSTAAACTSGGSNNAINSGSGSDRAIAPTQGDSLHDSSPARSTPESTAAAKNNQPAQTTQKTTESEQPSTKTDTMSVEGEKTEVTLKRYNQASEIFTTYFPEKDFVGESRNFGEGTGAWFIYNVGGRQNKNVFVAMFFPAKATTLEELQQSAQERRLLEANQWQLVNRTKEVPYTWAKEKIVYRQRTGSQNIGGEVYVGEANGKAFYVITHYPAEYGDGFAPRANLILKNLQVKG